MTTKRRASLASRRTSDIPIVAEVRALIVSAQRVVATAAKASLTLLHWRIRTRIRKDILDHNRAGYGQEILPTLSGQLTSTFGRGFSLSSLADGVRTARS